VEYLEKAGFEVLEHIPIMPELNQPPSSYSWTTFGTLDGLAAC
jgi:hypothetical protein